MPEEYKLYCKEHNIKYVEHEDFNEDVIAGADILYMTRVQKERFSDLMEYERVKNVYILKRDMLCKAKENMKIMHPLPRVNEIAYDVDDDPHAYYIQQAQNGLYAVSYTHLHAFNQSTNALGIAIAASDELGILHISIFIYTDADVF